MEQKTRASDLTDASSADIPRPLVEHLKELRTRLLRCVLAIACLALILTPYAPELYALVAKPMQESLDEGVSMIAVEVASPFLTPFKLVLVSALFLAMPFLLHQAWSFAAPGLYGREKKLTALLLASASALFYAGALFAWYVVLPVAFAFFNAVAPEGITVTTDIRHYLSFVLKTTIAFGIAFEIPIAVVLAIHSGIVSRARLVSMRPYVVVFCFFIGMVLTPPDVISQVLLAVPAWLLFELGLLLTRLMRTERA